MILLNLILFLVILGVLWWVVSLLPIPHPFPTIIQVLFIILAVLALLNVLFGLSLLGVAVPRLL